MRLEINVSIRALAYGLAGRGGFTVNQTPFLGDRVVVVKAWFSSKMSNTKSSSIPIVCLPIQFRRSNTGVVDKRGESSGIRWWAYLGAPAQRPSLILSVLAGAYSHLRAAESFL